MNAIETLAARAAHIDRTLNTASGRVWNDGAIRTIGSIGRGTRILEVDELRHAVPSIFAEAKHDRTSDRYSFLPTSSILGGLRDEGWVTVLAQQQGVRDETRQGFQKHLIRFAHLNSINDADRPEIVLTNSHDRSCAYQLHAGVFRAVCLNGLVICDATFSRIAITHIGFEPGKIIEASVEIVKEVPRIQASIADLKCIALNDKQREVFAEAALIAKYGELEKAPVSAFKLLEPKRREDTGTDIYTTLNVVQENAIRGGKRGIKVGENGRRKRVTSRPVKGIDGNINLNKALWHIAESFKKQLA